MNNTKITCPACGRWGYFVLEEKGKRCRFCSEPLDIFSEDAPRQTQTEEFQRRWGQREPKPGARMQTAQEPRPQAPEDTEDRIYVGCFREEVRDLRKNRTPVKVYLINGYQISGIITSFDRDSIIVIEDGVRKVVMRHAVSTIVPQK